MSTLKKKVIVTEVKDVAQSDDAPNVVAYRVGKLEEAVREGFKQQSARLEEIVTGFVTEKEMTAAQQAAQAEHAKIWKEIDRIKSWGTWLVRTVGAVIILALLGLIVQKVK